MATDDHPDSAFPTLGKQTTDFHAVREPAEFVVLTTSHREAPLDVRERLARPEGRSRLVQLAHSHAGVGRAMTLVTCNRVECWGFVQVRPPADAAAALAADYGLPQGTFRVLSGSDAFLHAIRVASGLDSAVWGEPQISGQVLAAAKHSVQSGSGPALMSAVRGVVHAALSVRRRAGLGPHSRGAPEAAADLVEDRLGRCGPQVMVIGAGAVGRHVAARVAAVGSVTVADRRIERARRAAAGSGGRAVNMDEGLSMLREFDAVIVALSAGTPVLTEAVLTDANGPTGRGLLVVDLSFPRAVAPGVGLVPGVECLDIDGLAREEERKGARSATAVAEEAARECAKALSLKQGARRAEPVIRQLRSRAEAIRRTEIARARGFLSGDPLSDAAVLDKLADRLVNRLLHDPTERLRTACAREDRDVLERAARLLFRLEGAP